MIADLQNKTARVQPFEKGLNVVTSIDNHVGKSSLLKSLYYTLGAEVDFDSVWDRQSKLYVVTLSVDETEYCIARFMKRFAVFEGKTLLKITDSVTQELAPLLGDIFDFSVYLPNKDTGKVEMAPPAFTFMPYYIDQDKGWSGLYDSFASITQYKSADRIICGIPMKDRVDPSIYVSDDKSIPASSRSVRFPINAFLEETIITHNARRNIWQV